MYYRVWEFADARRDGEHGNPARIPTATTSGKPFWSFPAKLKGFGGTGLLTVLPDGRLWTDRIAYNDGWLIAPGDKFVPGSNWVDGVRGFTRYGSRFARTEHLAGFPKKTASAPEGDDEKHPEAESATISRWCDSASESQLAERDIQSDALIETRRHSVDLGDEQYCLH